MKRQDITCLLVELAGMPDQCEKTLNRFPKEGLNWIPMSWEGVPGETFSFLETACHLRDIEADGYYVRFQRVVNEDRPILAAIDGYELNKSGAQ